MADVTQLGEYRVPFANSFAVASDGEKGDGENGLQKDFAVAAKNFINYASEQGVKIEVGTYGYMRKEQIAEYANNGQPQYKNAWQYYIWGLAWTITSIDTSEDEESWWTKKSSDELKDFGLAIVKVSATTRTGSSAIAKGATRINGKATSKMTHAIIPSHLNRDETIDKLVYKGAEIKVGEDGTSGGLSDGASGGSSSSASFAEGAYFFTDMFKSIQDQALSELLKGDRALANDEPLWGSVKTAINTSMRSCMSAPDGAFIAWYPDYFGLVDSTPKLVLKDIELKDLTITHSDATFYSHVYTPGVTSAGAGIGFEMTQGVVSIESGMAAATSEALLNDEGLAVAATEPSALLSKIIHIPSGDEWKYSPAELYRRYGARPLKATQTTLLAGVTKLIEADDGEEGSGNEFSENYESNPKYIMPFLNALYEFMHQWSLQYTANLTMTFQPGLFPGNRIKVESLDISFYVESVSHNMDYSTGFNTTAKCTCPVGSLLPGMVNPQEGDGVKVSGGDKKNSSGGFMVSTT